MAMYTYDIDAQSMFDDRTAQFEKFGISLDDIKRVRSRVTDMWADAAGRLGLRMVEARRALRR